jgi:hypothetical protein
MRVLIKTQILDFLKRSGILLFTISLYIWRNLAGWIQRNVKGVRSDLVRILDELGDSEALRRNRIFTDYIHEVENAEHLNNV